MADTALTPEDLGREVRRIWVETVRALIKDPKRSWTAAFDDLDSFQQAADIAIGVGIAELAARGPGLPGAVTAVQLTDDGDWETIATWSGGELRNREIGDTGEYETELVLPDGRVACDGDWLIRSGGGIAVTREDTPGDWADFGPPSVETMLRAMHATFRLHSGWMPAFPTADLPDGLMDTRWKLINEEINVELQAAMQAGDLTGIADGICDAVCTLVGLAVVCGLPFDELMREVMRSNMSKTNDPDNPKLVKGPGYQPPRIDEVLDNAITCGF